METSYTYNVFSYFVVDIVMFKGTIAKGHIQNKQYKNTNNTKHANNNTQQTFRTKCGFFWIFFVGGASLFILCIY